jgi:multiple sugar transport system substrate-binding protein
VAATLQFYHTMWVDGVMPASAKTTTVAGWFTPFESGKIGMDMFGSFAVADLKAVKGLGFNVTPIPGEYGGSSSYGGGDEIGIPKGSKNVAAAETVLKWATSVAAQDDIARLGVVPIRLSVATNYYPTLDPRYKVFAKAAATGHAPYAVRFEQAANSVQSPWETLLESTIFDGANIKAALAKAQAQTEQILSQPLP